MIAVRARRAAGYNADEAFTYYVDGTGGGSDSNGGTKASPFATLSHALAVATSGQSIGLKRGSTFRAGTVVNVTTTNLRIGSYGSGALPIISGGTLITGWTQGLSGGGTFVQRAGNGAPASSSTPAISIASNTTAGNTLILALKIGAGVAVSSVTDSKSNTWTVDALSSNTSGARCAVASCHLTSALTTSDTITVHLASSATIGAAVYEYSGVLSSSFVDKTATNSGSGTAASCGPTATTSQAAEIAISVCASGSSMAGYTQPGGYTARESGESTIAVEMAELVLNATGTQSATWTIPSASWATCLVTYKTNTPSGTGIYSASCASSPAFVSSIVGGVTTGLALGSNATSLTSGQFFYSGGTLYVNTGSDPSTATIEAALNQAFKTTGADHLVLRKVEFRHGADRGVQLQTTNWFTVDRCAWRYIGYVSNSGALSFGWSSSSPSVAGARITRCTIDSVMNDGIWWSGMPGVQIDRNTFTNIGYLAGDVQSDSMQVYLGFGSCAGLWVHHNVSDMSGTTSPKGHFACEGNPGQDLSVGGVPASFEYNVCTAGAYVFGGNASNLEVRYNTSINQGPSAGGGQQVDATGGTATNLRIHHNLVIGGNSAGLYVASGGPALVGFVLANNTVVDHTGIMLNIQPASIDSTSVIANNITWNKVATGNPLKIAKVWPTSGGLTASNWDANLYPADFTAAWNYKGTDYNTHAAFVTGVASAIDAHSIVGQDPLFVNPSGAGGDYTLQVGSPARGVGIAVSAIGVAAGGNLGAF